MAIHGLFAVRWHVGRIQPKRAFQLSVVCRLFFTVALCPCGISRTRSLGWLLRRSPAIMGRDFVRLANRSQSVLPSAAPAKELPLASAHNNHHLAQWHLERWEDKYLAGSPANAE